MANKSILPELLPKPETYIHQRMAEWQAQPAEKRTPTGGHSPLRPAVR